MAMNGRPGIDIGRQVVAKGTGGRSISRRFATAEAVVEFFFLLCVAACVWPGLGEDAIVGRAVVFWRGLRFGAIDRLPPSCSRLDHLCCRPSTKSAEKGREEAEQRGVSLLFCVCVCVCRVVELHGVFKVSAWQNGGRRPNVAEPFFFPRNEAAIDFLFERLRVATVSRFQGVAAGKMAAAEVISQV